MKKLEDQKVFAEKLNGRLAMLGLVAAATSDILTGHMFFGMF
jgi:hypothetical protein|tara:strand:- start:458 stop:583 length:126 start_codon:yes stop_codon:yes gene_type:complete